jgi:ankyrin repeat protein
MASEDTATITTLLSHHASLTPVDNLGNTALHHASSWGNLKAVRVLISAGAPPLAPNKANLTPLDYSVTKQAAQYFQSIISDLEMRKVGGQRGQKLKLNTTVRAVPGEETQSATRLSPVSPFQTRAKDAFAKTLSPIKTTPGGVRLIIDTKNTEPASIDDNDVPFTAKWIERSPTDE